MRLRTALNGYKRQRDARLPGECRTAAGAFSSHGDRLVYVDPDGSFRDHSAALSGLYGVDRSRFGVETDQGVRWFDDIEPVRQHYYRETTLVETEYDAGEYTVHQYDLTLGRAHITHVELRGAVPADARLTAFVTFAPEGRETQVGRLVHDREDGSVVEVFHRDEHDYVAASTRIESVRGQIPERFEEILDDEPVEFPRMARRRRYEDSHLSGDVVVSAALEREGRAARTTLVTQLSDHAETTRERALSDVEHAAATHAGPDAVRAAARERVPDRLGLEDVPRSDVVTDDLRALSLLTAPTGARIAAPEFDHFYVNTGGYGYTWLRDDAETSLSLLAAGEHLGLDVEGDLARSAALYCESQLPDGSWTHRLWAVDGSVAPGWAHARIEGGDTDEYQADQTASVVAFLATVLRQRPELLEPGARERVHEAVAAGVGALEETLAADGLPERCQNCWENADGRFTHTAATYLQAYAAVARAPVDEALSARAERGVEAVLEGLDTLWTGDRYARGLKGGEPDGRFDSSTFALVGALAAADAIGEGVGEATLERLRSHVGATVDALSRETESVAGLARAEDDHWRSADQDGEKIWSLATAWGAVACARLGSLLADRGGDPEPFYERARELYELVLPEGPQSTAVGYLPEQTFDDGTPDSAAPLGWSHALRLEATALLAARDELPSSAPTPVGPDSRPRWTTGEKYGVGTVADGGTENPSKVWFTLTDGALTELRYPRVDVMNLRTVDFLVVDTDPESSYTVRTHNETRLDDGTGSIERRAEILETDALCFGHTVSERGDGRGHEWTLTAEYAADPEHDALLADVDFEAHDDREYAVFAVAETALTTAGGPDRGLRLGEDGSHLVARDAGPHDDPDEEPLLVDPSGDPYSVAVAMTAADRFEWATVAAPGSESLGALFREGSLPAATDECETTGPVLVGRLGTGDLQTTLAVGFAENADAAGALGEAEGALSRGFGTVRSAYRGSWQSFLEGKPLPESVDDDGELAALYRTALMVLRATEDKTYPGASIASPSVPWGEAVTADRQKGYGYNFVWSRDLYQVFTVFEAVGDLETARELLSYVYTHQQDENGFIPQNTYLDGRTRWGGEQMDNISFPQVMAYHLAERGVSFEEADFGYENVRRSADYVAYNGPHTAQERWEEESGYSPSSIAAEIAGLACAGSLALDAGEDGDALAWLGLADEWAARVEEWTATTTGAETLRRTPYYVRITRDGDPDAGHHRTLANGGPTLDERDIVDAGFLELVRLGIKPADDPVIENSVGAVDDRLRVETPAGPAFYRYNGDGYGERVRDEEGGPWSIDAEGKGRLWPIFTGERGEYELLAGGDGENDPQRLLETMAGFANSGRMIAEQVWDREYGTDYNWAFGEGTGSATPLAWSMAQYARLAHGVDAGEPVETPAFVEERYRGGRPAGPELWVDTGYEGGELVVSVRTDGEAVAIKSHAETLYVEPTDGEFIVRIGGEDEVVVAAADSTDLEAAGTSVERFSL